MNWISEPIEPISEEAVARAMQRQATLTKPPGSLGQLEDLAVRLCGMLGDRPQITSPAIIVFAADHGVAVENVSAFPQAVTGEMVRNFAKGGAAICILAKAAEASLEVVNMGTVNDPGDLEGVFANVIAPSTDNMVHQPAMTEGQVTAALDAGRRAVDRAISRGADLVIGGDMGIANTTSASALACAYLGLAPAEMAGPGTGLDDAGVAHKARIIEQALSRHRKHLDDPVDVLRRLGGFEIAALAGAIIRSAQKRLPFVVDGFIASSAALGAIRIRPACSSWLLLSHASAEPGYGRLGAKLSEETRTRPLLDLQMRLGEGSGAALAIPLIKSACRVHNEMATFAEAGVSES